MPTTYPGLLIAGVIVAFISGIGVFFSTSILQPIASMEILPKTEFAPIGNKIRINVVVKAQEPVNVFAGQLLFDSAVLEVDSIDYNTSIADLWAEEPWYSNGDGTLNFAGGTTRPGGFTGSGDLITVIFKTKEIGDGSIGIQNPRILRHDGAGTDVELKDVVESTVHVESPYEEKNLITQSSSGNTYTVTPQKPDTDLNGDGKQSIADVSIFMFNLTSDDARYDFNFDGEVGIKDLAILLSL